MQRAAAFGGMVALATADSNHNAYSDIPTLFTENVGWFLKHLGISKGQVTPLQQLLRAINGVLQAAAFFADCPALTPTNTDWRAAGQPSGGGVQEGAAKGSVASVVGRPTVCVALTKEHVDAVVGHFKACTTMLEWTLPQTTVLL